MACDDQDTPEFDAVIDNAIPVRQSRQQDACADLMAQLHKQCHELDCTAHPDDKDYESKLKEAAQTLMILQVQVDHVSKAELAGHEAFLIKKTAAPLIQALDAAKVINTATATLDLPDVLIDTLTHLLEKFDGLNRVKPYTNSTIRQDTIDRFQTKVIKHAVQTQSLQALQALTDSTFRSTMSALYQTLEDARNQLPPFSGRNEDSIITHDRILHAYGAKLKLLGAAINQMMTGRNDATHYRDRRALSDKDIFFIIRQATGIQLDRHIDGALHIRALHRLKNLVTTSQHPNGTLHIHALRMNPELVKALITELNNKIPARTKINDDSYLRDRLQHLSRACVDDAAWKQIMACTWGHEQQFTHDAQSRMLALIQQGTVSRTDAQDKTQALAEKFKHINYDVQRLALFLVADTLPTLFSDVTAQKLQWTPGESPDGIHGWVMTHQPDSRALSFRFTPDDGGGVVIYMNDSYKNGMELIPTPYADSQVVPPVADPAQHANVITEKLNPRQNEQQVLLSFRVRPNGKILPGPGSHSHPASR